MGISIKSVVYGHHGHPGDPGCHVQGALGVVESLCQGKSRCSVAVRQELLQGEDTTCITRGKSLDISYQCRPAVFRSRTLCRGDTDNMDCQDNQQGLVIINARWDSVLNNYFFCPDIINNTEQTDMGLFRGAETENMKMEKCVKTSLTSTVERLCVGRQLCQIEAEPGLLDSPLCENLTVFLKVTFACVYKNNLLSQEELVKDLQHTENKTTDETTTQQQTTQKQTTQKQTTQKQTTQKITTLKQTAESKTEGLLLSHIRVLYTKQENNKEKVENTEQTTTTNGEVIFADTVMKKTIQIEGKYKHIDDINNNTNQTTHAPLEMRPRLVENMENKENENSEPLSRMIISTNNFLSNDILEDPALITLVTTAVVSICLLFTIIITLASYRKRAGTSNLGQTGNSTLVNLDTVSVESEGSDTVFINTEDNTKNTKLCNTDNHITPVSQVSQVLPVSPVSPVLPVSPVSPVSPRYLTMTHPVSKNWGIISSTPGKHWLEGGNIIRTMKLSENSEIVSGESQEVKYVTPSYSERVSSEGGSVTLSLEEKVSSEDSDHSYHSFLHFSHQDSQSRCECHCEEENTGENITFII